MMSWKALLDIPTMTAVFPTRAVLMFCFLLSSCSMKCFGVKFVSRGLSFWLKSRL